LLSIGATGHIGGAVLDDLVKTHPSLRITALVRPGAHSRDVFGKYKSVTALIGSLEDHRLLEKTTADGASIVISKFPNPREVIFGI
jgi:uncharacterized protein YbjT (DUF2867 family)